MAFERLELAKDSNASLRVKGFVETVVYQFENLSAGEALGEA